MEPVYETPFMQSADVVRKSMVGFRGHNIIAEFWDTAGQERFQYLGRTFYRGADCFILMFDISKLSSFLNLSYWIRCIEEACEGKLPPILVIANKADIETDDMWAPIHHQLAWIKLRQLFLASTDEQSFFFQTFPSELTKYLIRLSVSVVAPFPKEGKVTLPFMLDYPLPAFKISGLHDELNDLVLKLVEPGIDYESLISVELPTFDTDTETGYCAC